MKTPKKPIVAWAVVEKSIAGSGNDFIVKLCESRSEARAFVRNAHFGRIVKLVEAK